MNVQLIKYGISGIYAIKCISNNKRYIGSSKNVRGRLGRHLRFLRKNQHTNAHLQNAFNLYGENSFYCELLEVVENLDNLTLIETKYINFYQSAKKDKGFNLIADAKRPVHSEETRKKMSERALSRTDEQKMKINKAISEANRGRKMSPESIKKMLDSRKNTPMSQEAKRKISQALKGRSFNKVVATRPVLQFSLDGKFIQRFESMTSISPGKRNSGISRACKNVMGVSYGYRWMYAYSRLQDREFLIQNQSKIFKTLENKETWVNNTKRPVLQISSDGNILNKFDSVEDATRAFGSRSQITLCLKNPKKQYQGCYWSYAAPQTKSQKNAADAAGKRKARPILQFSLEGQFLKRFESVTSASEQDGHRKYISKACKKNMGIAYGYRWMYAPPSN